MTTEYLGIINEVCLSRTEIMPVINELYYNNSAGGKTCMALSIRQHLHTTHSNYSN